MYKYARYVADGTKGASYCSRPELRSSEPSASISRRFVYYARRSCKDWCRLHAVEKGGLVRRPGSSGRVASGEEPLTNGVGGIYLIGKGASQRSAGARRGPAVEAAEAVEALESATQNLVELGRGYMCTVAARRDWQQPSEKGSKLTSSSNRMRPLSRIAPASFRTGATARRGRAAANQEAGGGGRCSTRRATPGAVARLTADGHVRRLSLPDPGARWRGLCGRRWEPLHLTSYYASRGCVSYKWGLFFPSPSTQGSRGGP